MSDDPMAVAVQQIEFLRHRCDMEVAHIAELKEQIKMLRAERDEARREVCEWLALSEGGTEQEHADEAGWDCFKEENK